MYRRARNFCVSRGQLAEHLSEVKILQSANREVTIFIPNRNHRPYPSTLSSGPSSIRGGSKRTTQLEKRSATLEERNSRLKEERLLLDLQLSDYRTSGRSKLADAVRKNVLRLPDAKVLARRTKLRA
jgi:hypothetical protein